MPLGELSGVRAGNIVEATGHCLGFGRSRTVGADVGWPRRADGRQRAAFLYGALSGYCPCAQPASAKHDYRAFGDRSEIDRRHVDLR